MGKKIKDGCALKIHGRTVEHFIDKIQIRSFLLLTYFITTLTGIENGLLRTYEEGSIDRSYLQAKS